MLFFESWTTILNVTRTFATNWLGTKLELDDCTSTKLLKLTGFIRLSWVHLLWVATIHDCETFKKAFTRHSLSLAYKNLKWTLSWRGYQSGYPRVVVFYMVTILNNLPRPIFTLQSWAKVLGALDKITNHPPPPPIPLNPQNNVGILGLL